LGFPSASEEAALREQLNKLNQLKQHQVEKYAASEEEYLSKLRSELNELVHSSFLGGYVPILPTQQIVNLVEGESAYWEGQAQRRQMVSLSGSRTWMAEAKGVILLTNHRLVFSHGGTVWQESLDIINKIALEDSFEGGLIISISLEGYTSPLGFDIPATEFTVTTAFSNHTIRGNCKDFVVLLKSLSSRTEED
jgi:hypothetical protein